MKRYDFMHLSAHPVLWQVPMVVSIGVFDGLHRGHLTILDRTISLAKENEWESMVITFDKNPKMATKSQPYHSKLTTEGQMQEILANLGVNHMVVIDFSADFSKLTAEEFLTLVCAFCQVKAMVVGEDFRCGAPASSAGPVQLQEYLNRLSPGAFVEVPPFVQTDKREVVSSTLVRKKLLKGALEEIQSMLGRPYELDLVAHPSKFTDDGLLYRTASFMQLLPMAGVYDAYLTLSDDTKVPVKTIIGDEDLLIIPKEVMWDMKLLRTKRLSLIAKGSSS
ncbi:MAG: FAD synthetase family protein [Sphaerochaeta sp.]|uniref:FAD synthetase family protein n=1 Tax=Sphaerochaeta sp. S2 TaxID=2798868 RepID=UPI0018E9A603|nr:FAD synthetase family protein [Sphaerochaeta sp. S2]MBJ2357303.1 FAD synthetase family protein [Sphaerochaeta sp. S2]MDD4647469.1 FAD synthetase family protein [Sphaerochaeta sp.]